MKKKGIKEEEILSVGDRVDSEIQISKKLNMLTLQVKNYGKGRYFARKPTCDYEIPDFIVDLPAELLDIEELEFGE